MTDLFHIFLWYNKDQEKKKKKLKQQKQTMNMNDSLYPDKNSSFARASKFDDQLQFFASEIKHPHSQSL